MTSRQQLRKVALGSPAGFIATGFGSGLSRYAPGTVGSLAALLLAAVYLRYLPASPLWLALLLVAALLLGVWCCGIAGRHLGVHDHSALVWDEFVGQWLVLLAVPVSWQGWLAAFVLFRVFDILKPWPVRTADRLVKGGWGVMLDDILAAVYALLLLLAVDHLWPSLLAT